MSPERTIHERENSPRENTVELIHLLERLPLQYGPTIIDVIQDKSVPSLERLNEFNEKRVEQKIQRDKSEFKNMYMQKFNKLMDESRITGGCKEYFFWSINQAYDTGVRPEEKLSGEGYDNFDLHSPIPDAFLYLTEDFISNPESGGIFQNDSAQTIEMKIYNRSLSKYSLIKHVRDTIIDHTKRYEDESEEDYSLKINKYFKNLFLVYKESWDLPVWGTTMNEIIDNYDRLYGTWQMQIEQHYGIIPHTEFSDDPKYLA